MLFFATIFYTRIPTSTELEERSDIRTDSVKPCIEFRGLIIFRRVPSVGLPISTHQRRSACPRVRPTGEVQYVLCLCKHPYRTVPGSGKLKATKSEVPTRTPIVDFSITVQADRIDVTSCRFDDNKTAGPIVQALMQKPLFELCIYGRSGFSSREKRC